jgi:hypothetical protein
LTIISFLGAPLASTISLIFESAIFYYLCNGSGTVRVKLVLFQRGSLCVLSNFDVLKPLQTQLSIGRLVVWLVSNVCCSEVPRDTVNGYF